MICCNPDTAREGIQGIKTMKPGEVSRQILFGSDSRCLKDQECGFGICHYGICTGYLLSSNFYMREKIEEKILEIVEDKPDLKNQINEDLSMIVNSAERDPFLTGRALMLMAILGGKKSISQINIALSSQNEVVKFFSFLALCRLRDSSTENKADEFLNHQSEAVRMLAEKCSPMDSTGK
jgi:hypothetical protein